MGIPKSYIVGGTLIVIVLAIAIPLWIWDYKNDKKRLLKEQTSVLEDEQYNDEGKIMTMHAQVVDMACFVKSVGYQNYKQPKAVKFFEIQFQKDDGDVLVVSVAEEMYDGFDMGLRGMLTLVDGQLVSFEPDEE